MAGTTAGKRLGILVGGGPAPGINGVISAATIEAIENGLEVVGIYDGFKHLMLGRTDQIRMLKIDDVSRIHYQGGSILHTARDNPTRDETHLKHTVQSLLAVGVRYLVTIGGDDTAYSAKRVSELAGDKILCAHVPKTIDNDLPLPGGAPTFGFQTARHVGTAQVQNLMEDSRTTTRWYFVVAMGRHAGHLALGIGKAASATLTIIAEEFEPNTPFCQVADILECGMLKRVARGREDGVAILAEGIAEKLDPKELEEKEHVQIEHDDHGHIRLAEVDLGKVLQTEIKKRFKDRGQKITIVPKNIGYELRCAPPIPFDCEYVRDLGYGAVRYLLSNLAIEHADSGAMVCLDAGRLRPIPFEDIINLDTHKTDVRYVDIHTESYAVARRYMFRLEADDVRDPEKLASIAKAANMTPDEFTQRYGYIVDKYPSPSSLGL